MNPERRGDVPASALVSADGRGINSSIYIRDGLGTLSFDRRQIATLRRKTDAKRWAEQTQAAIREGRYFKTIEARRHTFEEMVERYIADVVLVGRRRISRG